MNDELHQAAYEIIGPDEQGVIRLKMPNLDPNHAGEFFCVTLGTAKDAIAVAMCQWLRAIRHGDCN